MKKGSQSGSKQPKKNTRNATNGPSKAAGPHISSKKKLMLGLLVITPTAILEAVKQGKMSFSSRGKQAQDSSHESSFENPLDEYSTDESRKAGEGGVQGQAKGAGSMPALVVGRSSKQNDRVSFEVAKDHHLWFHVQV